MDRSPKSPKSPKSPHGRSLFALLRERPLLGAAVIALSAMLVAAVVTGITISASGHSAPTHQVGISQVLTLADQHKLRSVAIKGDEVTAKGTNGQIYVATKEDGQTLTTLLMDHGAAVTVEAPGGGIAGWVQTGLEVGTVLLIVVFLMMAMRRTNPGNGQAVPFGRSRAKRFSESHPTVLFQDVAGVAEAKQELEEIVQFLKYPDKFSRMGARIPKGVLLVGPPGTGKTLISRAVAGEAGVAFFSVSGSEFVEMFVGVGASRVRDLFKEAKENTPCIVFIDEIDAVGRQRGAMPTTGNDEREQTLNQLLVEMDGFEANTNVIVIAATNRPDVLDPALLRPGRFDRQVMLDKPDVAGRLAILEVHGKGKPLDPEVSVERLARQTTGFSGADLANLMNEGALLAARRDHPLIQQDDLEESILRVVAGPERKSRVVTEAEKAIVAYHEVGHAIVMRSVPGSDTVQKVTAIARGMALGITFQAPAEDRYLMRRSELLAKLAGLMGGRAAEEIMFGDITTGAAQDIKQATNIARKMVCEFGMSPLGNILISEDGATSAQIASRVDSEVSSLVEAAYDTARSILATKKDRLIAIAEHLIEVETIDGSELDDMLFAPATVGDQPLTLEELAG
ncbi:MAG: ATP-dependent zinc metalloprotease FtsH [Ktedonobacterales bacterium]